MALNHFGDNFDETFAWYMENGYVYVGPEVFVVAYECNKEAFFGENCLDKPNAFMIGYVAGDLKRVFELAPHDLEWVIFEREATDGYKCYEMDRIRKRICYG